MLVQLFLVEVRGSSAAPKQKAFDRGGPVWPPLPNAKYNLLGGFEPKPTIFQNFSILVGGCCPPDSPGFGWGSKAHPNLPPK